MTISPEWLELVQDPMLCSFFPDDEWIARLLQAARKTRGVSESGLLYNILGTRCSGDAHTSIANGLINRFNTWLLFSDVPKADFKSWHEGDDGIAGLTAAYAHLSGRVYHMDCFGFTVKAFITQDINTTSFCGRFLSSDGGEVLSYCDPYRTLSKLHISFSKGKLQTLLLAKCLSYAYTDGQTPVVGPIVQAIASGLTGANLRTAKQIAGRERWLFNDATKVDFTLRAQEVDERLRIPFAIRTGISPRMQEDLESYYREVFREGIPTHFEPIPALTDLVYEDANRLVHVFNHNA
jgi:hypothetical protein